MYFPIPAIIAIQLQKVAVFDAPDPWNDGAPATWKLSVYRMTQENNRALFEEYSAARQLESATGKDLDGDDTLGIRSQREDSYRALPLAMVALWQSGQIATDALPRLVAAFEGRLQRNDYLDLQSKRRWPKVLAYVIAGLGMLFLLLGVYSYIATWHSQYGGGGLWCTVGLLYLVVAAVLLQRSRRKQQRIASLQAEILRTYNGRAHH